MLVLTILIVLDTSLRFDRIAGRMAGGAVAATIDEFLYGHNNAPVFMPSKKKTNQSADKEDVPADVVPAAVPGVEAMAAEHGAV